MNLLFLSQLYPDSLIPELLKNSKVGLDWAAHNLCQALIKGFQENEVEFDVINVPHVGSWPPFYSSTRVADAKEGNMESISFCNISYLKRFSINRQLKKHIWRWCRETKDERIILFYNFDHLNLVAKLKQDFPDVKIVLLVTDLSEYMTANRSIFNRINEALFSLPNLTWETAQHIDGYLFIASAMKERLPIGNKPWRLMEGIYNDAENRITDTEKIDNRRSKCSDHAPSASNGTTKTIVYAGNLAERYGISMLLDAFCLIDDPNYRLVIRGNGECEEKVRQMAKADSRIQWMDRMSRKALLRLQQDATLLVNPVPPSQEFTRYFFPSKTLEYMASGTPTVMFPLSCIPEDYVPHLLFFDEATPESMAQSIQRYSSLPAQHLEDFGQESSLFILKNKTPKAQCQHIIEFFHQLLHP